MDKRVLGRLLLISNSTNHGEGYLDHCMDEMLDVLGARRRLVFVPFALHGRHEYAVRARDRFGREGVEVRALTTEGNAREVLAWGDALFIGGGNTFRLLETLQEADLLDVIRRHIADGMVYMGVSAGANLACPTIRTTNDMPIVQPHSFDALALVPFQINPHFVAPPSGSTHMGETRAQRLLEFLEENTTPVVAIREGVWIRAEGDRAWLGGKTGACVFRRGGASPEERLPGSDLSDVLEWPAA